MFVRLQRWRLTLIVAALTVGAAVGVWAAVASGNWGGLTTAQDRAFSITVDPGGTTISQFRFNIKTPCQSRLEVETPGSPVQIAGDNTFSWDSGTALGRSCRVEILNGLFTPPSTATGTLRFSTVNPTTCGCGGVQGNPEAFTPVVTNWSVNQGCTYTMSAATFNAEIAATPGTVNVTTGPSCRWTAIGESDFVTVANDLSVRTGSGAVDFSVAANTYLPGFMTYPRTGTILVAGQPFQIEQPGCTFGVAPTAATHGSAGGTGAVAISAPNVCSWDVSMLPAWASTTSGGVGSGAGTWQYSVSPNSGAKRSQFALVAGHPFSLTQLAEPLKETPAGTGAVFTLADAADENWSSLDAVAGRSYCGELAPARTATDRASPLLTAYRANATTLLGNDTGVTPRVCFIAPATEAALFNVAQSDSGPRTYRLITRETTLWANWFFIGGTYSSFTLLRNTSNTTIEAAITWRTDAGSVAGTTTTILGSGDVVYYDARDMAPTASTGSVEVAYNGEPGALVGSQTTLSPITGLSFDAVMASRNSR